MDGRYMDMQRICAIFAGGPEDGLPCLPVPEGAFCICADSGLRLAERLGIVPDLVLGDFDSLGAVPHHLPYRVAPVEKDDTDTMLAARTALEMGFRDVRIYGAFGGRLDHTVANLQTLLFLHTQGASGMLIGERDYAAVQGSSSVRYVPRREGYSLSLFSMTPQCTGICERGVQYPLENAVLTHDFPLGVSNRILAEEAEIRCGEGTLLVVCSRL